MIKSCNKFHRISSESTSLFLFLEIVSILLPIKYKQSANIRVTLETRLFDWTKFTYPTAEKQTVKIGGKEANAK